jgi:hypothetical protein
MSELCNIITSKECKRQERETGKKEREEKRGIIFFKGVLGNV